MTLMRHVISTHDFDAASVSRLMDSAEAMRRDSREVLLKRLRGAVVATLFYEPSTRTRLSFESAVTRLGGRILGAENARENSSAKKGESLDDVFRVVGCYADAIVIRHHETNAIAESARVSPVPIINAGAGSGEHPTQALLDVYTIWRELGRLDGLHVCVMGDLKYGRTVHSLLRMLTYFSDIDITLLHPDSLDLPEPLREELAASTLRMHREHDVRHAMADADVVYQTRVQRERLASPQEADEAKDYVIGQTHLEVLKPSARILHPLPRVDEIAPDIDNDERAAYFRQVENGLYIRMALIDEILKGVLS